MRERTFVVLVLIRRDQMSWDFDIYQFRSVRREKSRGGRRTIVGEFPAERFVRFVQEMAHERIRNMQITESIVLVLARQASQSL